MYICRKINNMDYKDLRKELMSWLPTQGIYTLTEATRIANVNYNAIYNQLNDRSEIKLSTINELVQNLNEKFCIKVIEGKPIIVRR
jgi:hypothetical protein